MALIYLLQHAQPRLREPSFRTPPSYLRNPFEPRRRDTELRHTIKGWEACITHFRIPSHSAHRD